MNIYGAKDIFYYFVFTKTLNMNNNKWELSWLGR